MFNNTTLPLRESTSGILHLQILAIVVSRRSHGWVNQARSLTLLRAPIVRLQANLTKAAGGPAMSEEQIRQAQDQIKRDGMPAFDPVSVPHTAVPPRTPQLSTPEISTRPSTSLHSFHAQTCTWCSSLLSALAQCTPSARSVTFRWVVSLPHTAASTRSYVALHSLAAKAA
jgi:hypothetical protein